MKFTSLSPEKLIAGLKKEGKKIWIVGGSQIIDLVRKKNLIDEYILNIAPVILGKGLPLFCEGEREDLILVGIYLHESAVMGCYNLAKSDLINYMFNR
ncbi:MAG: dihydrofolate reductase family protein [Acetatifactor sp.]|nr:dihydrofolate reductase family protein [Acetatifactor sp.]